MRRLAQCFMAWALVVALATSGVVFQPKPASAFLIAGGGETSPGSHMVCECWYTNGRLLCICIAWTD